MTPRLAPGGLTAHETPTNSLGTHLIDVAIAHEADDGFQLLHLHVDGIVVLAEEYLQQAKRDQQATQRQAVSYLKGWTHDRKFRYSYSRHFNELCFPLQTLIWVALGGNNFYSNYGKRRRD